MQLLPQEVAHLSCDPFRRLALLFPSRLQRLEARVISWSGCAAKNAASPARLMPVATEQALVLLFAGKKVYVFLT